MVRLVQVATGVHSLINEEQRIMGAQEKEYHIVGHHLSSEPEIGRWLWVVQDTRRQTLREIHGLSQAVIDWQPGDDESSIGTVLYHITVIEADWLYVEVMEQPFPPEIDSLFLYDIRDGQGRLTQVQGCPLEGHLRRLEIVRSRLIDTFQQMSLAEFRRVHSFEYYDVTPEWVLHHLVQHEAEHRGQIGSLRARAERNLALG